MPGLVDSVARGQREVHLVARVGVDRLLHLPGQLAEELVGEQPRDVQAARFGEGVVDADRQVQEVVALVQDHAGVRPPVLGDAGAGGGGLPEPRQQQRPDQPGTVFPDHAFRQAGEQDAAVEDLGEREGGGRRPEQLHRERM